MKRSGPSTDPCGTPWFIEIVEERELEIYTKCFLSVMYDEIHLRAESLIPNSWKIFLRKKRLPKISKQRKLAIKAQSFLSFDISRPHCIIW